jgi:hypothetical protein
LLTSIGLGFLISVGYLLPLTAAFLVLALTAMLFGARDRRGYGPFLLAIFAASGVLMGKFAWDSRPTVYGAIELLVIASLWNMWPRLHNVNDATTCSDCRGEEIQKLH